MSTRRITISLTLFAAMWLASTGCIQDPSDLEARTSDGPVDVGGDIDVDTGSDTGDDVVDVECEGDDDCEDRLCVGGECVVASSCRGLVDAGVEGENGTYLIDPAGNAGEAFEVYCDFEADGGAGYTMVRFEDGEFEDGALGDDVEAYRQACQERGLELIVPRTRAHGESIKGFNEDSPPNVVGVYRQYPGAAGLHNWEGRCQGEPCSFYLSDSNSAGCGEFQPDGTGAFDVPLVRTGDGCFFGTWEDREDATVATTGSVLCSTNDAGPPVHKSCFGYRAADSVYNAGPHGISGRYRLMAEDGSEYTAFCDMQTHGGGWTLAMKVDGTKDTFRYNSPLWTNDQLYNPDAPDLDRQEAKLRSFTELSFTQLLVGLEGPQGQTYYPAYRYLPLPTGGDSLYALFADGEYVATEVGREAWKATMPDSSLQPHCNYEGLNSRTTGLDGPHARVRVGIVGNEQNDCSSPDSRIGLGSAGSSCGQNDDINAGNVARCGGDGGDRDVAAMGALFVRDVPVLESCQALQQAGVTESGVYPIAPGGGESFNAYCEMELAGGGWTVVAINGLNERPQRWWGNAYPRPGASHYGDIGRVADDMHRLGVGSMNIDNYSIDAKELYEVSEGEVLAYVGGATDDYITTELPAACNFFDGDTICDHNTYTGLTILHSDGSTLTDDGQACTTGRGLIQDDQHDEFGLHLLAGTSLDAYHCANTDSQLGQGGIGRLYTTFDSSNGWYWDGGALSHWNTDVPTGQPGVLMLR